MSKKRYATLCLAVIGMAPLTMGTTVAADNVHSAKSVIKIRPAIIADATEHAPVLVASSKPLHVAQASSASVSEQAAGVETDDSDLFGTRGGYFHPYVTFGVDYTDNLFNVAEDTQSSWIGRVAPGIWFSMPRSRTVPIRITPHNTAPGGLQQQVQDVRGTERYQAYALGGLNARAYSEDSDLNSTDARLEGLFRYNFRGGLSLQALDAYSYDQDQFGIDSATQENLRRYQSNIFMATADWDFTEKLRAKVDYSNFILDYDDEENAFLDRTDNVADIYGYYKYSPKTAFFLQYRYVDVGYDTDELRDNTQNYGYAGIEWDTTDKLALAFKAGYQQREYEDNEVAEGSDYDGFTFDLNSLYRFTEKTQLTLKAYSRSEESDSAEAADKLVLGIFAGYQQRFSEKWSGVVDLFYENSDYDQIVDIDRDDDRIYIKPALRYEFREWFMTELAYSFDKRDSTDDIFDYDSNTVILNLNFAM